MIRLAPAGQPEDVPTVFALNAITRMAPVQGNFLGIKQKEMLHMLMLYIYACYWLGKMLICRLKRRPIRAGLCCPGVRDTIQCTYTTHGILCYS